MVGTTRKFFSRIQTILKGALFRILLSFSNLIISLFIIRLHSTELWGQVVYYLLFLDLAFSLINWGHSPYLNREFSLHPAQIAEKFRLSFFSRSYILLAFIVIVWVVPAPLTIKLILTAWSVTRFIYQAFDPLIQYERKYLFAAMLETAGILIVVLPFALPWIEPSVDAILKLYALSFTFRCVAIITLHRKLLEFGRGNFPFSRPASFLIPALPFLLLTFTAMLQQRADLYVVAIFLPPEAVAQYQVLLNLLIFGQLGASLLLSPFSKNIFRLPSDSFKRLEKNFMTAGVMLSLGVTLFIYIITKYIYTFEFSMTLYGIGYFYGVIFYFYLLRNYQLGKAYKQVRVALYSLAGFGVNVILSYALTPRFGMEGALSAGVITQAFIAILYFSNPFLKVAHATR